VRSGSILSMRGALRGVHQLCADTTVLRDLLVATARSISPRNANDRERWNGWIASDLA